MCGHSGILFNYKEDWSLVMRRKIDATRDNHVKRVKPVSSKYCMFFLICGSQIVGGPIHYV